MNKSLTYIVVIVLYLTGAMAQAGALDEEGINARPIHKLGITGQGVHIGLLSHGNVRDGHAAFERGSGSAVINLDFTGLGFSRSAHDTNMAGLLVSGGSEMHPLDKGISPGATVYSARIIGKGIKAADYINAFETIITKHHCRVIVTGVQLPADKVKPDGNSNWSRMYDYYADTYDVFLANAAGNEFSQVTIFGDCYNGLTTAGLKKNAAGQFVQAGRISNSGPTADGRKKPEISAPSQGLTAPSSTGDDLWTTVDPNGFGLTSFATPFTAGTAALLLEFAARSKIENDDRSEVIKAVIVNSVYTSSMLDKKGSPARQENSISEWDQDSGYGRLNALAAYKTLAAGPITENQSSTKQLGWVYGVMPKQSEHAYKIQGIKGKRLVLTVTWHRKLNKVGTMFIDESLRFAVDVKVVRPSGQTVVFEPAGLNNLIKTDCVMDEDGVYQVVLRNNTEADGRDYGMAFELL